MAESLVVGAAVGAVFGELLKAVLEMKGKAIMFKQTLGYLQTTLIAIAPVIKEIEQHNNDLGRPKEELESLIKEMEQGTDLVYKCSKISKLNFPARIRYHEQLAELVESLVRFFMVNMQAQTSRDVKETLIKVRRIHSAVNKDAMGTNSVLESKSTQGDMDAEEVMQGNNSLSQEIEAKADLSSNYNDPIEPIRKITAWGDYLSGSSAEVLGETKYGTSYKVNLVDGTTIVMKRLKDVSVENEEVRQRMEIARNLCQHPNVMPLLGWYNSNDEKILIYDYMEDGVNLSMLLHGTGEMGWVPLDWSSRLEISVEVAKGIAHIHSYGGMNLVHGNISSSNVLVRGGDLQCSISDLGLASLLSDSNKLSAGRKGYQAPEIVGTGKFLTKQSDVYSFGVLLREILTGKSPGDKFDGATRNNNDLSLRQKQVMDLADKCMRSQPFDRPLMNKVVEELESIKQIHTCFSV